MEEGEWERTIGHVLAFIRVIKGTEESKGYIAAIILFVVTLCFI